MLEAHGLQVWLALSDNKTHIKHRETVTGMENGVYTTKTEVRFTGRTYHVKNTFFRPFHGTKTDITRLCYTGILSFVLAHQIWFKRYACLV